MPDDEALGVPPDMCDASLETLEGEVDKLLIVIGDLAGICELVDEPSDPPPRPADEANATR